MVFIQLWSSICGEKPNTYKQIEKGKQHTKVQLQTGRARDMGTRVEGPAISL